MTAPSRKLDRFQFLRGEFAGDRAVVRPPWALPESRFVDACSRCDACQAACPEGIVVRGRGGFPEIDFARGECTFCAACVEACPDGALLGDDAAAPWRIRAVISDACLSAAGVACRVCGDHCGADAIRFRLAVGGVALAEIDGNACTGCGACVAPCPVGAVTVC